MVVGRDVFLHWIGLVLYVEGVHDKPDGGIYFGVGFEIVFHDRLILASIVRVGIIAPDQLYSDELEVIVLEWALQKKIFVQIK